MKKTVRIFSVLLLIPTLTFASLWATSALLNPEPYPSNGKSQGAIIRVYGANVWGVRGYFAMHTWVATKATNENEFNIYEVIGWRLRRSKTSLRVSSGDPKRSWYGSQPVLLYELTGDKASQQIPNIAEAVKRYPYLESYTMWPGPNSNSFTEWIALEVPELDLKLPMKAIGKGWMRDNHPH